MFDAIEDIPTQALIDELQSRGKFVVKSHEANMRYLIWSGDDPHVYFKVEAGNAYEAAFAALDELGWSISEKRYEPDAEDDAPLTQYLALYVERDHPLDVMSFLCQAEDIEHAEEQCLDAYPAANVVWVEEGTDVEGAKQRYWYRVEENLL